MQLVSKHSSSILSWAKTTYNASELVIYYPVTIFLTVFMYQNIQIKQLKE